MTPTLDKLGRIFTVFSPQNDAIDAFQLGTYDQLENILLHHLVHRQVVSNDFIVGASFVTAANTKITLTQGEGESLLIGDVAFNADAGDIQATNGIIHGLADHMTPPTVLEYLKSNHPVLVSTLALDEGEDDDITFPQDILTIFAPTDAALGELEADATTAEVLTFHVASGQQYSVVAGNEPQTVVDVPTELGVNLKLSYEDGNIMVSHSEGDAEQKLPVQKTIRLLDGMVHVIDGVLLPPEPVAE
ncbi:MAG: fasciclin domain-containing protein [Myxococcales bacterium]|nr:fasciclin domain-containing protein [Myxococcales bacterium]